MASRNSVEMVPIANGGVSGDVAIQAAVANCVIELIGFFFTADNICSVKLRSGTADTAGKYTGTFAMVNGVPAAFMVPYTRCIFSTVKGEALNINVSTAVAVNGFAIIRVTESPTS